MTMRLARRMLLVDGLRDCSIERCLLVHMSHQSGASAIEAAFSPWMTPFCRGCTRIHELATRDRPTHTSKAPGITNQGMWERDGLVNPGVMLAQTTALAVWGLPSIHEARHSSSARFGSELFARKELAPLQPLTPDRLPDGSSERHQTAQESY